MVTDDERREIAARLREFADGYRPGDHCASNAFDAINEFFAAVGFDPDDKENQARFEGKSSDLTAACARHLADLVEPPLQCPHYDGGRHWCGIHDAPAVDRAALRQQDSPPAGEREGAAMIGFGRRACLASAVVASVVASCCGCSRARPPDHPEMATVYDSPSRELREASGPCAECGVECSGYGGEIVCRNEGCPMYGLPQRGRRW